MEPNNKGYFKEGFKMADFMNDITEVLGTVADKVKEYGGYAKIQALIKAEEAKKHDYYYRLGKKYYELYKDAPASDLTEITDKLVAADDKIAELKEELKKAQDSAYTDVTDNVADEAEEAEAEDIAADVKEVCEEVKEAAEDAVKATVDEADEQ